MKHDNLYGFATLFLKALFNIVFHANSAISPYKNQSFSSNTNILNFNKTSSQLLGAYYYSI